MRKINDGLTRAQRYYARHKDEPEFKARNSANANRYYAEHTEECNERNRANYWKDPAKHIAAAVQWGKDNRERSNKTKADFKKRNRGAASADWMKYQMKKKNQTPEMNAAEWAEINAMYLYNQVMPGKWHVDHIDPLDNGGLHHPSNLQILSEHDNCSKGARI